jgi:hypothetical protein
MRANYDFFSIVRLEGVPRPYPSRRLFIHYDLAATERANAAKRLTGQFSSYFIIILPANPRW